MKNEQQKSNTRHKRRRRQEAEININMFCSWQTNTNTKMHYDNKKILISQSTTLLLWVLTLSTIIITTFAASNNQQETTGSNTTTKYISLSSSTANTIQQQHQFIQASFSTPEQAINITHVTYDPLHDTVYLGATNVIYQLNGSDLSEQFQSTTGPVFDNPSCGITECHGYEDYMKPTQNVNKILVIDYQHKKLISCGSTKQGACRRYQLNNISQKEDLISMAVAANDDNSSTYAFIGPARYTYDPSTSSPSNGIINNSQQQVLYVATTYTKVGQSRDLLVPAIGTRTLDDGPNLLKLYENSFLDSARIDINSHLRDYFLVNYLYGFASSNYIYFVTVQKKATSRDYEELGYHTRIARICITDSSYNSYTEVDLKCLPNKKKSTPSSKYPSFFNSQSNNQQQTPTEYPLLQDAILVDAGSELLQSLARNDQSSPISADFFFNNPSSGSSSPDDNKVLLGVFSSARDSTQNPGEHSALCAFSLSQIEDKFNDNIHNCYTGKMQSRNMEYIAGNVQECPKSGQGGNVVNFCHETLKINGTLPIVSEASIQFLNTTLTAITATSHINSNVKNIYNDQLATELSSFNNTSKLSSTVSTSNLNQNQETAQHTVAFLGTSNGHLKKVLLNNASNGIEFEDVQLDTNPILSDIHLHSSGQQLIVATPYKVMKVPTHNCAQYTSCRECDQSKNPYCGWCSVKKSCTTKSECGISSGGENLQQQQTNANTRNGNLASNNLDLNSRQFKSFSNDSFFGKCIDLQSIVPDKIPLTSIGKVDLYIDRLPRLPREHSYKCIFDKKDQTTATHMSFGLSCPLLKAIHRPKIQPGKDHVLVDLAIRSSETNTDLLNGKITFFDCQLQTTCRDCLATNWGCNWCLNENICLFNTTKCEKGGGGQRSSGSQSSRQIVLSTSLSPSQSTSTTPIVTISSNGLANNNNNQRSFIGTNGAGGSMTTTAQIRSGNTINLVSQCPATLDVAGANRQDTLIADGSEKEPTIKVKNMPQQSKDKNNPPVENYNDNDLGFVQYNPGFFDPVVQIGTTNNSMSNNNEQLGPYMRPPTYPQYVNPPRHESETMLQKIGSYITTLLLALVYITIGVILLGFVYGSVVLTAKLKRKSYYQLEYRKMQSEIDSLEKSIKGECRLASMALQSDLNELVRHVDLSGIPILNVKNYIMRVFFPGINNHPLLFKTTSQISKIIDLNQQQPQLHHSQTTLQFNHNNSNTARQLVNSSMITSGNLTVQHPLKSTGTSTDFPMECFERLILTKSFLITFINTLETQPSFTIRDKLVQKSVSGANMESGSHSREFMKGTGAGSRLSRKATNLLGSLSNGTKRNNSANNNRAGSGLSKVVGGSANCLMASTTVAAQMLLSRVGTNKTSPLQPNHHANYIQDNLSSSAFLKQNQHANNNNSATSPLNHCMSTTTFNQRNTLINTVDGNSTASRLHNNNNNAYRATTINDRLSGCNSKLSSSANENTTSSVHHMLRRTDSIVEKMLTNWLALNMYDYFQGEIGQSLYMLVEALKTQLDRGPIDSVSGDAYYSLNEHKLLREPHIHFEVVNLYVIIDTDILNGKNFGNNNNNNQSITANNLLLDNSAFALQYNTNSSPSFYDENGIGNYTTSNTITLALRVLDCDTISQVKRKILNALYRNSPYSQRLDVNQVELTLRQPTTSGNSGQYLTVTLVDEDFSSLSTFNGSKRINTLRHYGITDQAIMMLNKIRQPNTNTVRTLGTNRTTLTDMLEDHYNNPYSEIQYGQTTNSVTSNNMACNQPITSSLQQQITQQQNQSTQQQHSWHLVKNDLGGKHCDASFSNESSPSSNSPSMMLLSGTNECHQHNNNNIPANTTTIGQAQQQQYYHASSSSTSSTGNVLDTNSTSVNSSSMNVTNLLMKHRNYQQPIYCQIGSNTTRSQHGGVAGGSTYYCQINSNTNGNNLIDYSPDQANNNNNSNNHQQQKHQRFPRNVDHERERQIYLTRMLTSKGTIQTYLDDFFKTILNAKPLNCRINEDNTFNTVLCSNPNVTIRRNVGNFTGACPPAVKWLFDLLDEAAMENGITDHDVIHAWKSNAFLLRFWVNFIKNPNCILDVEKSSTLDSTLSVIAQTLMDSCSTESEQKPIKNQTCKKMLFAKDIAKYKTNVKRFYQDIATMKPVSDQEIVKHMCSLSMANVGRFDTNLALKELCVYAVNYGVELMGALNNDYICQQLDLSQQLEQCFRSLTIFEAYR